jgi:hypothetical protein
VKKITEKEQKQNQINQKQIGMKITAGSKMTEIDRKNQK